MHPGLCSYVGQSPAQFYIDLRVSRAHALLNETSLSIAEIAAATGFTSDAEHLLNVWASIDQGLPISQKLTLSILDV